MLRLGPERQFKGKKARFAGRILYADRRAELYEALKKLGLPFKYIRENPWRYLLTMGHAWQLIRLRDQGFVELEEITLLKETEYRRQETENE